MDSGSSLCCITKSLLNLVDTSLCAFKHIIGVSGKGLIVKSTVTLLLEIGDSIISQNYHMFDNIHHKLILGVDFLKKYKCKINYEEMT